MNNNKNTRVLVVGGGVAGLTAGSLLQQQGFEVIVIEGRKRIGGRIHTDFSLDGAPVDLGASWINGSHGNPLYEFAKANKLQLKVSDATNIAPFDCNGKALSAEHLLAIRKKPDQVIAEVNKMAAHLSHDISRGEAVNRVLKRMHLSNEEMRVLHWLLADEESDTGVDVMQESLIGWTVDKPYAGKDYLFAGGYGQVISTLAKGLDIRLDHKVHATIHNDKGVRVETNKGAFEGDAAVITLPLAVLKAGTVRFSPELSHSKQEAINALGVGLLTKVVLRFPEVFWPMDVDFIENIGEQKGYFPSFLNLAKTTGHPVLVGFLAGDLAREFDGQSDAELCRKAGAVLHKQFGKRYIEPSKSTRTHWLRDEFSLGSYSALLPGTPGTAFSDLGAPNGRLFFAGEACDAGQYGSVPSAYRSAVKAAKDIANLVNGK